MSYKLTEDMWVRIAEGELEVAGRTLRYEFRIPVPQSLMAEEEDSYVRAEEARLVERLQRQLLPKLYLLGYLS